MGNTIGLYNYKWFYLMVLFLTTSIIGFVTTLGIYLHRLDSFNWTLCFLGSYLGLYIMLGGGLLVYHTQLSTVNLTTNEHQNMGRYKYLRSERGQYHNAFFKGALSSYMDRCMPGDHVYTLPSSQQSLLQFSDPIDRV